MAFRELDKIIPSTGTNTIDRLTTIDQPITASVIDLISAITDTEDIGETTADHPTCLISLDQLPPAATNGGITQPATTIRAFRAPITWRRHHRTIADGIESPITSDRNSITILDIADGPIDEQFSVCCEQQVVFRKLAPFQSVKSLDIW